MWRECTPPAREGVRQRSVQVQSSLRRGSIVHHLELVARARRKRRARDDRSRGAVAVALHAPEELAGLMDPREEPAARSRVASHDEVFVATGEGRRGGEVEAHDEDVAVVAAVREARPAVHLPTHGGARREGRARSILVEVDMVRRGNLTRIRRRDQKNNEA